MPSRHRCFLLTPTEHVAVILRRFAGSQSSATKCGLKVPRYPGAEAVTWESHNLEVEIAREVGTLEGSVDGDSTLRRIALDDPRWPDACPCGYRFADEDVRQEWHTRLYQRGDTGELVTLSSAPVGALYDSGRFSDVPGYQRNGAGVCLICKTPAGEWLIDGPATNGPGWTRSGTPPDIVVLPSIGIGDPQRMHGWLGGPKHNEPGWLVIDAP
jgi:hypothetical protein